MVKLFFKKEAPKKIGLGATDLKEALKKFGEMKCCQEDRMEEQIHGDEYKDKFHCE